MKMAGNMWTQMVKKMTVEGIYSKEHEKNKESNENEKKEGSKRECKLVKREKW